MERRTERGKGEENRNRVKNIYGEDHENRK